MWGSVLKSVGLASTEEYIAPRLSIGKAVADQPYSTGNFIIQVDCQALALTVKNRNDRIIWKSLQNQPFLFSSLGKDQMSTGENGVFKVTEHDEGITRIQTITKVERIDKSKVRIHGGLGTKLVLPTHMDYIFTFEELSSRQLQFSAEITHRDSTMADYYRLILAYESRPEEDFYGFGEQFSYSSLKGQKVPILVREVGYGKGAPADSAFSFLGGTADNFASYASIPHYISSDVRSLFMENSEYTSFDLRQPDRIQIRIESDKIQGRILDGRTMLDLVTEYTSYAGRMLPLPDWVSDGLIAGIQGGRDTIREILSRLQSHNVPTTAVLIQDWTGKRIQEVSKSTTLTRQWWNWESDDALYPDWDNFVNEINTNNGKEKIRVMAYVNPFLTNVSIKPQFKRNLFPEAQSKGYMVKGLQTVSPESGGNAFSIRLGPGLEAGLLDLTNPEARNWYKDILKEQVWKSGISGLMVDFGEHLPCDNNIVSLHSGEPASKYHNHYPEDLQDLHREVVTELGKEDEAVCFFRSAYTHSPGKMNLFWAGDQNVTWDQYKGIKSAVMGMISSGFSGFSITHCDIGGSNTVLSQMPGLKMFRTKELLYRWMELAAFTSAFRTTDGLLASLNAQFYDSDDSYEHLAHTSKLFVVINQYRKEVLKEAYDKGWPVMRHLVLYYPNDKIARKLTWQQYLLGSSMMIAPVLAPSTSYVKVYFPKDAQNVSWRHIWTGKYYAGDGTYKSIDTPLGQPAVFIKDPRGDDGMLNDLLDYATTYHQKNAKPSGRK